MPVSINNLFVGFNLGPRKVVLTSGDLEHPLKTWNDVKSLAKAGVDLSSDQSFSSTVKALEDDAKTVFSDFGLPDDFPEGALADATTITINGFSMHLATADPSFTTNVLLSLDAGTLESLLKDLMDVGAGDLPGLVEELATEEAGAEIGFGFTYKKS